MLCSRFLCVFGMPPKREGGGLGKRIENRDNQIKSRQRTKTTNDLLLIKSLLEKIEK